MRQALPAVVVVVLLAAGCGGGSKHAGPPPAAAELVRSSLAAAAASPGAQYDLDVTATLVGTLPAAVAKYAKEQPHARASGTIGRDLFTAHVTSSIPQIAIFTGDQIQAARNYAFLRFQGIWYGSPTQGLARFWRELPRLVLSRPAGASDLTALLGGAIHGVVGVGPSQDGTDTWELAGTPDPAVVAALVHPLVGSLRGLRLAKVAARSRALYDVGRSDNLPRRLRLELHVLHSDLPPSLARQFPDLRRVDAVAELDLSRWGEQPAMTKPTKTKSFDEYLSRLGIGG
jgi:hypothetical protein